MYKVLYYNQMKPVTRHNSKNMQHVICN